MLSKRPGDGQAAAACLQARLSALRLRDPDPGRAAILDLLDLEPKPVPDGCRAGGRIPCDEMGDQAADRVDPGRLHDVAVEDRLEAAPCHVPSSALTALS